MYTASQKLTDQINTVFVYHAPQGSQTQRYEQLRAKGKELAEYIVHNTPECREQSVALTKLQEVIMFANAAIACGEVWNGNIMEKPIQGLEFKSQ